MLKKLSVPLVTTLTALAAPLHAVAQTQQQQTPLPSPDYWSGPGRMMWGGGYWGGGYGWPLWEMVPMLILLTVLVCIVIFYFARTTFAGHHSWGAAPQRWDDPSRTALQILNERFAKGEIPKDEFEDKKAAILAGAKHYA